MGVGVVSRIEVLIDGAISDIRGGQLRGGWLGRELACPVDVLGALRKGFRSSNSRSDILWWAMLCLTTEN